MMTEILNDPDGRVVVFAVLFTAALVYQTIRGRQFMNSEALDSPRAKVITGFVFAVFIAIFLNLLFGWV